MSENGNAQETNCLYVSLTKSYKPCTPIFLKDIKFKGKSDGMVRYDVNNHPLKWAAS